MHSSSNRGSADIEDEGRQTPDPDEQTQDGVPEVEVSTNVDAAPDLTINTTQVSHQNKISHGIFASVHKLDDCRVRKVPATSDDYDITSIRTESRIYKHLGPHPRILPVLSCGDDYLDLVYMKNGNLEDCLRKRRLRLADDDDDDDEGAEQSMAMMLEKFACQALEAVNFIHRRDIVHSDLAARQFLLDDLFDLRLSDFGSSSIQGSAALGMEATSHFLPREDNLPSTIQSDIFALGSTLYEIFVGAKPYHGLEDDEIEGLYSRGVFPSVEMIVEPWVPSLRDVGSVNMTQLF